MYKLKYIRYDRNNESKSTYICGDKVPFLKYGIYDGYNELVHGFSTRIGGVSTGHLASLNLSFSRGDSYENVIENHRVFAEALGYDYNRLVFSDQVHGTNIYEVHGNDAGRGIADFRDKLKEIDGLVTSERDIPLITFYADCVPIYFYDPVRHAVGLAHSGWKGTVLNIAGAMVKKMGDLYNTKPADIICAIGPSICQDCYEVSEDVAVRFREAYPDNTDDILKSKGGGKYLLDLHGACRYNLLGAGVKDINIAMPDLCTCCNPDFFYSHRASHGMRGNLAAVIMLKTV